MAKDKKSFLLYTDLKHTVKQLPDDVAGRLFKHLLSYVNDENPVTDELLVNISFEPIKQGLKRDLKKWEETKDQKSEAGLKSAFNKAKAKFDQADKEELPKLLEKYKAVLEKEPDNKYIQLCVNYLQSVQQNSTPLNSDEQRSTESTVNVNDSVSVNVNVNDNVIDINKSLLSKIDIFDVEENLKVYFEIAKKFQELFIKNLKEKNSPTKNQENAKFKNYVDPIRLMMTSDNISKEQLIKVYRYLDSPQGDFWKSNILSTKKLREKFQQLSIKANESNVVSNNQEPKYTGNR